MALSLARHINQNHLWTLGHRSTICWNYLGLFIEYDSFHLCLFDFHFIYQFYFLMTTLVKSAFWNTADLLIFKSFQHHFKICLLWFLHKKRCSFYTHLFCFTEMRWMFISSTAIWVAGWDTSSVGSRAGSDLTSSKCEWARIWI